MKTNAWLKKTNIKWFGIKVYEKEEVCTEQNYEGEVIQVNVTPEYFNREFRTDNKKDNNC